MVFIGAGGVGFLLAGVLNLGSEAANDFVVWVTTLLLGIPLALALGREAWARTFTQVRLTPDHVEFDRFRSQVSWPLDKMQEIRVRTESTSVNYIELEEVSLCLTGPDRKRLHLTDLSADTSHELARLVSERIADSLEQRLRQEPIRFGPKWSDHLNIYDLGPPLLLTGLPLAFDLIWLGFLLDALYLGYLYRQSQLKSVVLKESGLLHTATNRTTPWSEVQSVTSTLSEVIVQAGGGPVQIKVSSNLLPLTILINRLRGTQPVQT